MRGLTARTATTAPSAGAIAPAPARRHGSLVATLVLIMLAIMIVRDIMVRRWTGTPAPPDVTRSR
jgi:ascorbate-specific PTS system EIIC-type component UlaA